MQRAGTMKHRDPKKWLAPLAAMAALSATPAFAHLDPAEHGSLAAGLSHPLFGADHVLAMVAVGLWAALLGMRRRSAAPLWLVPAAFVGTMMMGFGAAMLGVPLPFVEPAILASIVGVGLLAAVAADVPTPAAMITVGVFALFHGHAHGGELGAAAPLSFLAGFAISTALLHALGLGAGLALARVRGAGGMPLARAAGAATALGGIWLAFGASA